MIQAVSHVMYYVNDMKRALAWYQEKLGFEVNFNADWHYISMRVPGARNFRFDLHPSEAGSKDVGMGPILYFQTADIEKAAKDLQAKGVKTGKIGQHGPHKFMSFWDSEGNAIGLEEKK